MLARVLIECEVMGKKWKVLLRKLNLLYDLAGFIYSLDGIKDDYYGEAGKIFENAGKNIKYMVVYPSMLVIAYRLGEANFERDYKTMFGTPIKVNSKYIMKRFFDGKFPPWFDFGNDSSTVSKYGIVHAFEYALKTGLFRAAGVSELDLLLRIFDDLLYIDLVKLKEEMIYLKSQYYNDPLYERFINTCYSIKRGSEYYNPVPLSEIKSSPFLGNWADVIYMTGQGGVIDGRDKNIVIYPKNIYSSRITNNLEWIRVEVKYRLIQYETMINIYREHVEKYGTLEEKESEKFKKIERRFESLVSKKNEYLKMILSIQKDYGYCDILMFGRDVTIRRELYLAEIKYLKNIFRKMTDLRKSGGSETVFITGKYLPPGNESIRDHFDKDNFYYYRLNAYLRVKEHFENGIDPYTEVVIPRNIEKSENFEEYFKNPDVRIVSYIDYYDTYEANEKAFISDAFKNLYSYKKNSFFKWKYEAYGVYWWYKLETMMSLYKMVDIGELREELPCEGEDISSFSAKSFVEEIKNELNAINYSDDDERILDLWGVESKFNPEYVSFGEGSYLWISDIFIHHNTQQPLPFYWSVYYMATADLMGEFLLRPVTRELQLLTFAETGAMNDMPGSYLSEAEEYYKSRKDLDGMYLPLYSKASDFLKRKFTSLVERHLYVERSIREVVIEEEKINRKRPSYCKNDIGSCDEKMRISIRRGESTPDDHPFLDQFKVTNFKNHMRDFHRKTYNFYNKPPEREKRH